MSYTLENVTENIKVWFNKDPVRPELGVGFKTSHGREVYALKNNSLKDDEDKYVAFMCVAYTSEVPSSVYDLDYLYYGKASVAVPYSVWRYEKGAGKKIVDQIIDLMSKSKTVKRVVTLSPQTEMARNFHIRNGAVKIRTNEDTVNFEYELNKDAD